MRFTMPRGAEAPVWWAEVDDVRERIERRRAGERLRARGVRELRGAPRLVPVSSGENTRRAAGAGRAPQARQRPRRPIARRVGPRPDRVAALAVWLGLLLVVAALLSASH